MNFSKIVFKRSPDSFRLHGSSETHLFCLRAIFVFLFKEPPYFTAEPESRILVEVEETVDIVCRAMGECGEAVRWRNTRGIFQGRCLTVTGTQVECEVSNRAFGTEQNSATGCVTLRKASDLLEPLLPPLQSRDSTRHPKERQGHLDPIRPSRNTQSCLPVLRVHRARPRNDVGQGLLHCPWRH